MARRHFVSMLAFLLGSIVSMGLVSSLRVAKAAALEGKPAPAPVTLVGRIVCVPCELKLEFDAPADCGTGGHLFGFRSEDGNLFTLLETDRSRPVIKGERHAQQIVQIKGRRFPRSMILELQEIGPAPPGAARSAGVRRYYCGTCAITSFEPGPCVCCGEPVEETKPE